MTNKLDLPHKTMFEACNPGTKLVSESQVAAAAGIKVATVRTYSGTAVRAAGIRLRPVAKDDDGRLWYKTSDVEVWQRNRAAGKARHRALMRTSINI